MENIEHPTSNAEQRTSDLQIFAHRQPWSNAIGILVKAVGLRKIFCGRLVMDEVPEGLDCGPSFMLKTEQAQRLMDELWNCGLRPSEGTGSAGAMAATQKHLEDMRKISFDLLARAPGIKHRTSNQARES